MTVGEAQSLRKNFADNAEYFTEGKHFFKLAGEELKEFKAAFKDSEKQLTADLSRSKAGLKNGVSIRGLELIEEADDELICVPTPKIGQR